MLEVVIILVDSIAFKPLVVYLLPLRFAFILHCFIVSAFLLWNIILFLHFYCAVLLFLRFYYVVLLFLCFYCVVMLQLIWFTIVLTSFLTTSQAHKISPPVEVFLLWPCTFNFFHYYYYYFLLTCKLYLFNWLFSSIKESMLGRLNCYF